MPRPLTLRQTSHRCWCWMRPTRCSTKASRSRSTMCTATCPPPPKLCSSPPRCPTRSLRWPPSSWPTPSASLWSGEWVGGCVRLVFQLLVFLFFSLFFGVCILKCLCLFHLLVPHCSFLHICFFFLFFSVYILKCLCVFHPLPALLFLLFLSVF